MHWAAWRWLPLLKLLQISYAPCTFRTQIPQALHFCFKATALLFSDLGPVSNLSSFVVVLPRKLLGTLSRLSTLFYLLLCRVHLTTSSMLPCSGLFL